MKRPASRASSAARDVRLYQRLQVAAHALQKQADRRMKDATGMTTAQIAVLAVVLERPATTQRHIAEALGVNESAVTAMVRRLEALGLLTRVQPTGSRRSLALDLTPAGRQVLRDARPAFATVNATIATALADDEVRQLASLLARVVDAFGAAGGSPPDDGQQPPLTGRSRGSRTACGSTRRP